MGCILIHVVLIRAGPCRPVLLGDIVNFYHRFDVNALIVDEQREELLVITPKTAKT
jgi:hypothetical protein